MSGAKHRPPEAAGVRPPLHSALLDYMARPGHYSVARKEPPLLFASIPVVLQLAAGKSEGGDDAQLQRAACFFIRAALTHPGANHYVLLGLTRSSDEAAIKQHYRLMMRLVHPDFSSGTPSLWPADAATRLNLAYEVLSSPQRRARYDEALAAAALPPPAPRHAALKPSAPARIPSAVPSAIESRKVLRLLAGGFGVVGAVGVAALLITGGGDRESLVQRPSPAQPSVAASPPTAEPPVSEPWAAASAPATAAPPLVRAAAMAAPPSAAAMPASAYVALSPGPLAPLAPRMVPPAIPIATTAVQPEAAPAPLPTRVESPQPQVEPLLPTVAAMPAPPPPAPVPAPAPARPPLPGLTLADAQPMLATLLHHIESGRTERLLNMLDQDGRNSPAALALARQLEGLSSGAGELKVSQVQFRGEPAGARLVVTGQMQLQASGAAARKLALRIEFASRNGAVVMTGLGSAN